MLWFFNDHDLLFQLIIKFIIGFICPDEIVQALSEVMGYQVTHKHASMLMNEFDKDKNGKFDVSEFAMMIVSQKN